MISEPTPSVGFFDDVRPFWMDNPRVKCKNQVDVFYPPKSTSKVMKAKNKCNGNDGEEVCPFRTECLHYAINHSELYGCWGGTSERDRRKIRKARSLYGTHIYTFEDVRFPGKYVIARRSLRSQGVVIQLHARTRQKVGRQSDSSAKVSRRRRTASA